MLICVCTGETLPRADVKDLGRLLKDKDYEVFVKNGAMYGFKGIAGRRERRMQHQTESERAIHARLSARTGLDGAAMLSEGDQLLVGSQLRGGLIGLPGLSLPDGARKV